MIASTARQRQQRTTERTEPGSATRKRVATGPAASSLAGADTHMMDKDSMAKAQIAGQEFVFTLEDEVDLPSTTNMKTE